MKPTLCSFFVFMLVAPAVYAASDPIYAALRGARPDGRRVPVQGLTLERDVFRFQFDSGSFHFLVPVAGRTVGAVFVGKGSLRLTPATPGERRQHALASGDDKDFETLTEEFDELVLLFADDTAEEIQFHAPMQTGTPDPKAVQVYESYLQWQRKDFKVNFHIRVLQDLLNTPGLTSGVFLAFLDGRKYPPALAAVDPYGAAALGLGFRLGGEDSLFFVADAERGGAWYLCDQQAEVESQRSLPEKQFADALSYRVETTVAKNLDIAGRTTIRFRPLVAGLRVLPVSLLPKLRISAVSYAVAPAAGMEPTWQPAPFIQEDKDEDGDAAVVLPEAPSRGAEVLLRLVYKGKKVLEGVSKQDFVVEARESWYPSLGVFSDAADFELVYQVPKGNAIVSVGHEVESRTLGKQRVSLWKSHQPLKMAGFNFGNFRKVVRTDGASGLQVQVYAIPNSLDIAEQHPYYDPPIQTSEGIEGSGRVSWSLASVKKARIISPLAEWALVAGTNSAYLFTTYFGPLPVRHVAITQESHWMFGQAWPALVSLPYRALVTGRARLNVLYLGHGVGRYYVDQLAHHELAHQWWGHHVGAATYRDQWLEEGFAEFSVGLLVHHTVHHSEGWSQYDRFWSARREYILGGLDDVLDEIAPTDAGPITQGWRLSTQRSPSAYGVVVCAKGGYVLHMLRMMMWDEFLANPDERFIAMMQDFTKTYGGKLATTADFQKVVERHITPSMNATGDGKMDWFFNQWVYGTEVPRYKVDLKVAAGEEGKYRITGTIVQQGVSAGFRALVPVYVEFDNNESTRVGLLPLTGEATVPVDIQVALSKKPKRALINAHGEILARE